MLLLLLLYVLLLRDVFAVFSPSNRKQLGHNGIKPCLLESSDGHCPVFAENLTDYGAGVRGPTKNGLLTSWDVSKVQAFSSVFRGSRDFNQNLGDWKLRSATTISEMFLNCKSFTGEGLNLWDTSSVTDMSAMFSGATQFNGDVSKWDVSSVKRVSSLVNVGKPNKEMRGMFQDATSFNRNIGSWRFGIITSMTNLFKNAHKFVGKGLGEWDVSNVQDMVGMFSYAYEFNGDISSWNVAQVTDFSNFMSYARKFQHKLCGRNWILNTASHQVNVSFHGVLAGAGPATNIMTELCCPQGESSYDGAGKNGAGTGTCSKCTPGKWKTQNFGLKSKCTLCPSGKFSNRTGMISVDHCDGMCPAGYHGDPNSVLRTNVTSACLLCPLGRASLAGEAASAAECNACGYGSTYISSDPLLVCETCESGRYLNSIALNTSIKCQKCPTGLTTCERGECGFGTAYIAKNASIRHVLNHRSVSSCRPCPIGRVFVPRNSNATDDPDVDFPTCQICPGGKFQDVEDMHATNCKLCPAGKFLADAGDDPSNHDGPRDCIDCKERTFSLAGERFCSQCPVGTFEVTGSGCLSCPSGWMARESGRAECKACPAGTYQNMPRQPFCLFCLPGMYARSTGQSNCKHCPGGWLQQAPKSKNCTKVKNGSIVGIGGSSSIKVPLGANIICKKKSCTFESCSTGKYGHSPHANDQCYDCPAGYSSFSGAIKCNPCGKGKYSAFSGAHCSSCPSGYFQHQFLVSSTKCQACPAGYFQNKSGESSCLDLNWKKASDCRGNQFLMNDRNVAPENWVCRQCPIGTDCNGVDVDQDTLKFRVKDGWWQCPNENMTFQRCTIPGACVGVTPEFPNRFPRCADGRLGNSFNHSAMKNVSDSIQMNDTNINPLCSSCGASFAPYGNKGECRPCGSDYKYWDIVLFIGGLLLIHIMLVRLKVRSSARTRSADSTIKRSLMSHVQMCTVILLLNANWPNTLSIPMSYMTEVMSGAGMSSSVACSVSKPGIIFDAATLFYLKLLVSSSLPAVVLPVLYMYWFCCSPHSKCLRCGIDMVVSEKCGKRGCLCCKKRISDRHVRNKSMLVAERTSTRDAFWVTVIFFLYFLHPLNVKLGFQAFQCDSVCGVQYLSASLVERCWDYEHPRHILMTLSIAVPTVLIYALLMPISVVVYLRKYNKRGVLFTRKKLIFRIGFIYSGYSDHYWWWDSVIVLRKVLVILIITFAREDEYQIIFSLLVMIFLLFIQERARPFHGERKLNAYDAKKKIDELRDRMRVEMSRELSKAEIKMIIKSMEFMQLQQSNSLHSIEIGSMLILTFMVWSAMYVHIHECTEMDAWCNMVGSFIVAANVIFLFVLVLMFEKAWVNKHASKIRTIRKTCQKCFGKRCCPTHLVQSELDKILNDLKELNELVRTKSKSLTQPRMSTTTMEELDAFIEVHEKQGWSKNPIKKQELMQQKSDVLQVNIEMPAAVRPPPVVECKKFRSENGTPYYQIVATGITSWQLPENGKIITPKRTGRGRGRRQGQGKKGGRGKERKKKEVV